VLVSGNHAAIDRWRRQKALQRTFEHRPDLLTHAELSKEDTGFLQELGFDPKPSTHPDHHN